MHSFLILASISCVRLSCFVHLYRYFCVDSKGAHHWLHNRDSLGVIFFKYIYWLCYYSCPISIPLTPLHPAHPLPPKFPPYSSCPWVIIISSLASTFPTLFLPSPCLFSTYHLCYLFSVPFPPSPPPTPLLTTLHVISISMVLFL